MRAIRFLALLCILAGCTKNDNAGPARQESSNTARPADNAKIVVVQEPVPPAAQPSKPAPTPSMAPGSPEARALAFFIAIQSGDPAALKPFLLVPSDCDYMKREIDKDGADVEKCRRAIEKLHEGIDQWLPRAAEEFKALRPTGVATLARAEEPEAPEWAYKVSIEIEDEKPLRVIGAFKFENEYRFVLGIKKAAP